MAALKRRKTSDPFSKLRSASLSLGGLSLATAVGAGVAAKAPAGTPSLTSGFSTLAGFAPIGVTALGGAAVLGQVRKLNKKKDRKSIY